MIIEHQRRVSSTTIVFFFNITNATVESDRTLRRIYILPTKTAHI